MPLDKLSRTLAVLVTTSFAAASHAALIVTPGSVSVPEGTPSVVIPVTVAGGDLVDAFTLDLRIGDGGPVVGGTTNAPITILDSTFSLFSSVPSGSVDAFDPLPSASSLLVNGIITAEGSSVSADGELFRVTVDTSGLAANTQLSISFADLDLYLDGQEVSSSFNSGQLTVTVVPEPFTLSAISLAGLALTRRRRA